MTEGVLDTSVFIAAESGRPLRRESVPDDVCTTVITMAELEAGVLTAQSTDTQAARLRTLQSLAGMKHLTIDEATVHEWARLRAEVTQAKRKININDLWIAAIAVSRGLPVVTQDADFDVLAELGGLTVIRV
jgi:predicted nucleic acid-binding protein